MRVRRRWLEAVASACLGWAGCGEAPAGGASLDLRLEVRGARAGTWILRVRRADGVVVSEDKAVARPFDEAGEGGAGLGEVVALAGACDPSVEAQPNVVEVEGDPVSGVILPRLARFEVACDAEDVRIERTIEAGRITEAASVEVALGANRCTLTTAEVTPVWGGPARLRATVACHQAFAVDDPRVVCAAASEEGGEPITARVRLGAGDDGPLPWAQAEARLEARRVEVELEPLLGVTCALQWRFADAWEAEREGLAAVASWEIRGAEGDVALTHASTPTFDAILGDRLTRACAPACAPGACGDDGCGRPCCAGVCTDGACRPEAGPVVGWSARRDGDGLVLGFGLGDRVGRARPNEGILLHLSEEGGREIELFAPATGALVALVDGEPAALDGGVDAAGALVVRLPGVADGALIGVVAATHGEVAPLTRAVRVEVKGDAVALDALGHEVVVVGARPDGAGLRLRGAFPTPLAAWAGAEPVAVGQGFARAPVAPPFELGPRWVEDASRAWCRAIGLCVAVDDGTWATTPGWLTPPVAMAPAEVGQVFGDTPAAVAPIELGGAPFAAWSDGARACWLAARAPGGAAPRILVASPDGPALEVSPAGVVARMAGRGEAEPLVGPDHFGACGPAPAARMAAVVLDEGAGQRAGWASIDLAASGASLVRGGDSGPSLVAVWGGQGGWAAPGGEVEVLGAVPEDSVLQGPSFVAPITRRAGVAWARLPSTVTSGPVWLDSPTLGASTAVWLPVMGSDADGDGVVDERDLCPRVADAGSDADLDGLGDACDADADGDGWRDDLDRCPGERDDQRDRDGDDVGDACDAFPADPAEHADLDGDGIGDEAQRQRCGDAVLAPTFGEQCDDGNLVPGDGCEPDCRLPCGAAQGARRAILDSRTGRCFLSLGVELPQDEAALACERLGAHLPIPSDAVSNAYAHAVAPRAWLGLDDRGVESRFETQALEPPTYTAWTAAEPSSDPSRSDGRGPLEDCVAFVPGAQGWQDLGCGEWRPVSCELAERPCGDGVTAFAVGEQCDDGNAADGDGCAGCRLECPALAAASPELARLVRRALPNPSGGCLLESRQALAWHPAEALCEDLGGHLVVPDAEREARALAPLGDGWLGLHDSPSDGDWWAVTGQRAPYLRLAPRQFEDPRVQCALTLTGGQTWLSHPCEDPLRALCELEPTPCGDGVVQAALGETCDAGAEDRWACAPGCQSPCPGGDDARAGLLDRVTGHCLVALDAPVDAASARAACETLGGSLLVPDDPPEAAWAMAVGGGWLGLWAPHGDRGIATPRGERPRYLPDFFDVEWTRPPAVFMEGCVQVAASGAWSLTDCRVSRRPLCELDGGPPEAATFTPAACGDGILQLAHGEACDGPGCGAACTAGCALDADPDAAFVDASSGRCVYAFTGARAAAAAAAACAESGGELVVPASWSEERRAGDLGVEAWLGLSDAASEGRWVDAAGADSWLGAWLMGEPDDGRGVTPEDCATIGLLTAWLDRPCQEPRATWCARPPPTCGDGRLDPGEACDDGDLVRGDGCDCAIACAAELDPSASALEPDGRCLWASAPVSASAAAATCEAAGGRLLRTEEGYRQELARRLTGGACGHVAEAACPTVAPALCERAPEPCGDGTLQSTLGETCDDGNRVDGDGCESDCRLACEPLDPGAAVITGARLDPRTGTCYLRPAARAGFDGAAAACAVLGGRLAVPLDPVQNALVAAFGEGWLGLDDRAEEGRYATADGLLAAYLPFARGQPDNSPIAVEDCVSMYLPNIAAWSDRGCDEVLAFTCELPAGP